MDNSNQKPAETPKPETDAPEKAQNSASKPASKSNNNVIVIILVIVGVLVVLGAIGSFVAGKVLNKAGKSIVENATNTKITTNKDGTTTIESKDGSNSISTTAKLPDDFPKDIPLYSGQKLTGSSRVKSDTEISWQVTAETTDKVAKASAAVKALYSAWDATSETQQNDNYYYYFSKGNYTVNLYVAPADNGSTISYTVTQKTSNE